MNPQLIAKGYIGRDWAPIPIPYKSKVPVLDDWTNLRVTKENVAQFFNGEKQNVGVLLGEPSKNLIDIDFDCPEAVALAPIILPPTNAIFGRAGKPRSHFLYTVRNLICSKRIRKSSQHERNTGGTAVHWRPDRLSRERASKRRAYRVGNRGQPGGSPGR